MSATQSADHDRRLAAVADRMRAEWRWPSPETGFARFVFDMLGDAVPVPADGGDLWPAGGRLDEAPLLAATGFLVAVPGRVQDPGRLAGWAAALDRLAGRDPFPADRLSFAYRPLETLGIVTGAAKCEAARQSASWLRVVVDRRCREGGGDLWSQMIYSASARLCALPDSSKLYCRPQDLELAELALAWWLNRVAPASVPEGLAGRMGAVAGLLVRRAATDLGTGHELPRLAVVHAALRGCVQGRLTEPGAAVGTEAIQAAPGRGPDATDPINFVGLPGHLGAGNTINVTYIRGNQQMGDSFNIGGDVVGSAVGANAAANVRDIQVFRETIDRSQVMDGNLKARLKEARDAIEQASLPEADKRDVLDDFGKLTAEMEQHSPEAGRVRRLFNRIAELAPSVASILSSAAQIAQAVHGSGPHP